MSHIDKETPVLTLRELLNSTTPTRDVVHRYGCSYRGFFQSTKALEGPIPFESGLARDALRMFELAPEVVMIVHEPFVLHYAQDREIRRYTPDFLLFLRDGRRAVVEVKWQKEADQPHNQYRFKNIGEQIASAGAMFAVLTEITLRTTTLQQNMSLLERHKRRDIPPAIIGKLLGVLRDGSIRLGSLAGQLGCYEIVLAAIGQGILAVDLRSELTDNTLIRRA